MNCEIREPSPNPDWEGQKNFTANISYGCDGWRHNGDGISVRKKEQVKRETHKSCELLLFALLGISPPLLPHLTLLSSCPIPSLHVCHVLSCVWLFETPWTGVHQAPLYMEFSRQEYWNELPFPPPAGLPDPGIRPASPVSRALQADSLPLKPSGNWKSKIRTEKKSYYMMYERVRHNWVTFTNELLMIFLAYFSKYLSKPLAHIGLNSRYSRFYFISLFLWIPLYNWKRRELGIRRTLVWTLKKLLTKHVTLDEVLYCFQPYVTGMLWSQYKVTPYDWFID